MNIDEIKAINLIDEVGSNVESIEGLIHAIFHEYPKRVHKILCEGVIYGGSLLAYGTGSIPNDVDIMLPKTSLKNRGMQVSLRRSSYTIIIWKRENRLRDEFKTLSITLKDDEKIEDFLKRLDNYRHDMRSLAAKAATVPQKHYYLTRRGIPTIDTVVCLEDSPLDVLLCDTIPFFTIGGLYAEGQAIFEGKPFLKSRLPDVSVLDIFKDFKSGVLRTVGPIDEVLSANRQNVTQFVLRAQKYYFGKNKFRTFAFSRSTCQLIASKLDCMYTRCLLRSFQNVQFYRDLTNYVLRQIIEEIGFTDGPLQLIMEYSRKWNSYYDEEERRFLERIRRVRDNIQHGEERIRHYMDKRKRLEEKLDAIRRS